jgi:peptidoglycan/LPS O-acetylase OafA/YrhL
VTDSFDGSMTTKPPVPAAGGAGPGIGAEGRARPAPAAAGSAGAGRLHWLDALRGIAVLAVVVEHLTYLVFLDVRRAVIVPWFDSGKYGVMVFFLVSGYIIPASLERHGNIGRFWVGRAFRLYPLLVAAVGALLVLTLAGLGSLEGRVSHDPVTVVVAHATFLQDLLGVQNFFNVLWTLSYEMVFYLLVTALFIGGMHRSGPGIALGLGMAAVVFAPVLPALALSHSTAGARWVVGTAAVALVVGIACAVRAGRGSRLAGAIVLGGLAVVLFVGNQRAGMWEGLVIVAVMFTGTTIYRAEHGDLDRGKALAVIGSVWVLALIGGVWNFRLWPHVTGTVERQFQQSWAMAILMTGATFGIAWLLRRRRFPRPLEWVGLVSYSIYLMHTVLLSAFHQIFDPFRDTASLATQTGVAVAYFTLLFGIAWCTYRFVEAPGQRIGRRLARNLKAPRPAPKPRRLVVSAGSSSGVMPLRSVRHAVDRGCRCFGGCAPFVRVARFGSAGLRGRRG